MIVQADLVDTHYLYKLYADHNNIIHVDKHRIIYFNSEVIYYLPKDGEGEDLCIVGLHRVCREIDLPNLNEVVYDIYNRDRTVYTLVVDIHAVKQIELCNESAIATKSNYRISYLQDEVVEALRKYKNAVENYQKEFELVYGHPSDMKFIEEV